MDLKDWFASRSRSKKSEELQIKQPLSNEEYCALWTQCFQCRELLYTRDLRQNLQVCPKCQYHGRIGATERIEQLCDPGSFVELNRNLTSADPLGFVDTDTYINRVSEAAKKSGLTDAVVTGLALINGRRAALGIMDFGFLGGSMGSVVGEKLARLIEEAQKEGLPLVIISSSGGARMQEGIFSLMQMAKTASALQTFGEHGLLYISILSEPTYGGVTASFAMLGDIIIAEPGARIGFAGRRVIEQTIRQRLPVDFQTAEYLLKAGQIDMIIERSRLKIMLSQMIDFHKSMTNSSSAKSKKSQAASIISR